MIESFSVTLQAELLNRRKSEAHAELRMAVFHFIEVFHNGKRRHSSLECVTPAEGETRQVQRKAAA